MIQVRCWTDRGSKGRDRDQQSEVRDSLKETQFKRRQNKTANDEIVKRGHYGRK